MTTAESSASPTPSRRRRVFKVLDRTFTMSSSLVSMGQNMVDTFMYALGIFLIVFASVIISGLTYSFFYVLLPMIERANNDNLLIVNLHIAFVLFLLSNIISNYFLCIITRNKGPLFDKVVRELADATDFCYPETPEEVNQYKNDYEQKMLFRIQRRQARRIAAAREEQRQSEMGEVTAAPSASNKTTMTQRKQTANTTEAEATTPKQQQGTPQVQPKQAPIRGWMIMGPHEWGFCDNSHQAKPPRSHFDHVTKTLVLNMDHYCPWMFNTVGYFNYRYFYNFLLFVLVGMIYGALITYKPFFNSHGSEYREQLQHMRRHASKMVHIYNYVPLPHERSAIAFSFLLCCSVGIAVFTLWSFHTYLLLTGQTTIEFHGNCANRRRAKELKKKYTNPYDLGLVRNFQQIYGTGNPIIAVCVPSAREPEFLPLPLPGQEGLRPKKSATKKDSSVNRQTGPSIV